MTKRKLPATGPSRIRCAIYTRKSSEEGLDQSYNSLDAQRDACEAYVMSQTGEGWSTIPTHYDDGGFSGGNMDRPGLKQLLADIAAKRVDVVVVYKVDRLTRSLTDFARIVESFDAYGVSFVSVTQAFNTTSSMGRLTLNVLLSFAQFEREVTGERIRDKIAASKRRGMWMGGVPPLGYRAENRTLVPVEEEVATLRHIYTRYLALGSVPQLRAELEAQGIRSPGRRAGEPKPFSRGNLRHMLTNRIYLGEIVHKDAAYPGQHSAIIETELFEAVAKTLAGRRAVRGKEPVTCQTAVLTGRVVDASGGPMSPVFTRNRHGRTYRYYVSTARHRGDAKTGQRAPAAKLEQLILNQLRLLFPSAQSDEARWGLLARAQVGLEAVALVLTTKPERGQIGGRVSERPDGSFQAEVACEVRRWGGRSEIVRPTGRNQVNAVRVDPVVCRALGQAHQLVATVKNDPSKTFDDLGQGRGIHDSYIRRLARLAFLAPDIQEAILDGRQPVGFNLQSVMHRDIPMSWHDQRAALGFPAI